MNLKLQRIAFATFVSLTIFALPVRSQTTDGDANAAEFQSIAHDDLMPLGQKAQAAIDMASSDPAQACQVAKSTIDLAGDAKRRFGTLYDKMVAEGADVSPLTEMKARLEQAPDKMQQLAQSICSGQFAAYENDPTTKDATRIGVYMKAYTDDTFAAETAHNSGDTATFCAKTRDGGKQLNDLTAYLVEFRKSHTFTPENIQGLDKLDQQVAGFRTSNEKALKSCPTG